MPIIGHTPIGPHLNRRDSLFSKGWHDVQVEVGECAKKILDVKQQNHKTASHLFQFIDIQSTIAFCSRGIWAPKGVNKLTN